MADLKISQLSSATALAGTEVVPVVQGGSTKKATIDQILSPASGKGINFSAAGGDMLTIYDEGTWTPYYTNATPPTTPYSMNVVSATYTRIGRQVTVRGYILTTAANTAGASGNLMIAGLPFTPAAGNDGYSACAIGAAINWGTNTPLYGFVQQNSPVIELKYRTAVNGGDSDCTAADLSGGGFANVLCFSATYFV